MRDSARRAVAALVFAMTLGIGSAAFSLPLHESLPVLPASPVAIALDEGASATYRTLLVAGETLVLDVAPAEGQPAAFDLDLFLYDATSTETSHTAALRRSAWPSTVYPESIAFQAAADGVYYIEVHAAESSGAGRLSWSVVPEPLLPVYRFYNVTNGTHFYTPSAGEAQTVRTRWPHVFRDEGVAYSTKATKNSQPLYRFYNRSNGSHFYTASPGEKATIESRWAATYAYEGETFKVSPVNDTGTKAPVFRFYNTRNGSHFFTANDSEANTVRTLWPGTYRDEGVAFYLGQ